MKSSDGHQSIILASGSPRRRDLLTQVGVSFQTCPANIEEVALEGECPEDFVRRMAREKAAAVVRDLSPDCPVLGADTEVILDSCILGKPENTRHAAELLRGLSGRTHEVYSAVAVIDAEGVTAEALNVSRVTFAKLDYQWIDAYIQSGDPMDKAGAYGVQGKAGEKIERIEGSFYGVMGLPLFETTELLRQAKVIF